MLTQAQNSAPTPLHRMHPLICQTWVESDEGCQRSFGYTVHLSIEHCKRFREEFWRNQRAELGEATPSSYVKEDGDCFTVAATREVVDTLERLTRRNVSGSWGEGANPSNSGVEKIVIPALAEEEQEDIQVISNRLEVLNRPLVTKACAAAAADFTSHTRKVPRGSALEAKPYFSHLQRVAILLAECGYDEQVLAAGYLHDHLEDLPKLWNKAKLGKQFGQRVADLVDWVTHHSDAKSWGKRTDLYREHLKSAPPEARAISAADKISNMEDAIVHLRAGHSLRTLLRTGWKENSQKFHALLELFEGEVHGRLVDRYRETLQEFDRLGRKLEK